MTISQPYGGYNHSQVPAPDLELAQVGPGTPGGEYLRRFWHPVGLSREIQDLPKRIRIMGEDLVLFRDGRGQLGLLELHCPHRGTSLEFGMVQRCGIRCCYHGWVMDTDGRVLETPGEPEDSTLKDRFFHGAYPTLEHKGIIFGYMGPPELRPPFPIYDSFERPGYRMFPVGTTDERYFYDCNWLQLAENNGDVIHFVFLHYPEEARVRVNKHRPSVNPEVSLEDYFAIGQAEWDREMGAIIDDYRLRVLEWQESPIGVMSIHTRRAGEYVWVRLGDYMMPNVDQFAPTSSEPKEGRDFEPPMMTSWTVPVDDTHTMGFNLMYMREDAPPRPPGSGQQFTSDSLDRSYGDRQREPGDYEAQESQRPMAVHDFEHLTRTDQGVILVRKLLREGIRAVQRGGDPRRVVTEAGVAIPTYCRNAFVRVPPAATLAADRELLTTTARQYVAKLLARSPQAAVRS